TSSQKLYDVNQQVHSGSKIQQSYQDTSIYIDAMRLNYEITTLEQSIDSSSKAKNFANNIDTTLNSFTSKLDEFKTKLTQAANASNSQTSLDAIANELEAYKKELINLANTSINGQFLFSGSALSTKPISADGTYHGNAESLTAVVGSGVELTYNVDGKSLFLGKDSDYSKVVSTNVAMYNQTKLHPDIMDNSGTDLTSSEVYITSEDTIRDLVGDTDSDTTNDPNAVFYLAGRKSSGETFSTKIQLSLTSSVEDLLESVGTAYGNTGTNKAVNVEMNAHGQIEVTDLTTGNQTLEMSLFGAIDRSAATGVVGNADQANVNDLAAQTTVDIIAFNSSNYATTNSLPDAINYTQRGFEKDGNTLTSNVSQVVKQSSEYATSATKLSEVAGSSTLNGKALNIDYKTINGTSRSATINLSNAVSTVDVDTDNDGTIDTSFTILDANGDPTGADDVSYQQLTDIVSMLTSGTIPTNGVPTATSTDLEEYQYAVKTATNSVEVGLDKQGRFFIKDRTASESKIEFGMSDSNTGDYSGTTSAALSFMANDSVTIETPSVNMFEQLDAMIEAVRSGNFRMDSTSSDPRNIGIQNALSQLDHIADHVEKAHTKIGALSNALTESKTRAETLKVNVVTVQQDIVGIDLAEAYLELTQVSNSYEAMLSAIAKVNSMSLLDYM
ncbi:MAG: flagellin, partial [Clostridia bacterium]|nr:flagellin [Clostridia bacterium]